MDSDIRSTKNDPTYLIKLWDYVQKEWGIINAKENIFWPMFYNLKTMAEVIVNRARTPNQFPDK